MANTIARGARRLLRTQADPRTAFFTIAFVALFRIVLERNVQALGVHTDTLLYALTDRLDFYAASFLVFTAALRLCLPGPPPGVANIISIGLLFGLFPPLMAAFVPALGGGYAYMTAWQLHFLAPADQALSETVTLWMTILACLVFVSLISRSFWRGAAAAMLAWAGLAWTMVIAPSLLLHGAVVRAEPQTWRLQVTLALSCIALFMIAHGETSADWLRRLPRQLPFLLVLLLGALRGHALGPSTVFSGAVLLWLLLSAADPAATSADCEQQRRLLWHTGLSVLLLGNVLLHAPLLALWGGALLIVRWLPKVLRHGAQAPWPTGVTFGVEGLTALCAFCMGSAQLSAG
jgi:hypothetical protein